MENQFKKGAIHIFILTSPIGICNAEKVIEKYINSSERTVLIVAGKYKPNIPKYWSDIVYIDSFISENKIQTTLNRKKVLEIIKRDYSDYKEYHFYVMDFDAVTNYIVNYFHCVKKQVNIIEDGLVNYIKSYPKNTSFVAQILKVVYHSFFGIKTKMYFGTCTGIEIDAINKQFLKYPELSLCPQKTLPIEIDKINFIPDEKIILILGQTMENKNEEIYRNELKKLIKLIKNKHLNKEHQIIYKPHRWENWEITDILHAFSIKLAKDLKPIESIVAEIKPKYIYSFGSSALINISMSMDSTLRQKVDIFAYPYLEYNIYKGYIQLFVKSKVGILHQVQ